MNEIIKREPTAVTAYEERDPFEVYADSVRPGYVVGKLLKFSKGDYLLSESAEPVGLGTVVVAAVDQLLIGWIRWGECQAGRSPHGAGLLRPISATPAGAWLSRARQLGGRQQRQAARSVASAYLPMLSGAGDLWTFSTSSKGGHGAIGELSRAYAHHRRKKPDGLPQIALKGDSYPHQDKQYGRIKFPVFELAGWQPKDRVVAALAEAGLTPDESPPVTADRPSDLDDDIPF